MDRGFKNGVFADRISCHRFEANGFRTILAAVTYRLMFSIQTHLRTVAEQPSTPVETAERCRWLAQATFSKLRFRLLKVAFLVRQSV